MLHQNILNQANQQAIAKLSFDTVSLEFKAGLTLHLFWFFCIYFINGYI